MTVEESRIAALSAMEARASGRYTDTLSTFRAASVPEDVAEVYFTRPEANSGEDYKVWRALMEAKRSFEEGLTAMRNAKEARRRSNVPVLEKQAIGHFNMAARAAAADWQ